MVADIVKEKLHPEVNPDFDPVRKGILDPSELSLEERNELIKRSPEYGNIICRCEMISSMEMPSSRLRISIVLGEQKPD